MGLFICVHDRTVDSIARIWIIFTFPSSGNFFFFFEEEGGGEIYTPTQTHITYTHRRLRCMSVLRSFFEFVFRVQSKHWRAEFWLSCYICRAYVCMLKPRIRDCARKLSREFIYRGFRGPIEPLCRVRVTLIRTKKKTFQTHVLLCYIKLILTREFWRKKKVTESESTTLRHHVAAKLFLRVEIFDIF